MTNIRVELGWPVVFHQLQVTVKTILVFMLDFGRTRVRIRVRTRTHPHTAVLSGCKMQSDASMRRIRAESLRTEEEPIMRLPCACSIHCALIALATLTTTAALADDVAIPLANPGFESGATGWTSATTGSSALHAPPDGSRYATAPNPPEAGIDGDGMIGGADLAILPGLWGECR